MHRLLALLLAVTLWLGLAPPAAAEDAASRYTAFARELRLRDVEDLSRRSAAFATWDRCRRAT